MPVPARAVEYDSLFELIQSRTGLRLQTQQRAELIPLLQEIADIFTDDSPAEFLARTPMTDPEWQRIIGVITVGETYFFRYRDQFDALRNHILPVLIAGRRRSQTKRLFLWSAGCATGEEPYSLAILLRDLIDDLDDWDLHILGTDINAASLDHARRGCYRQWSFRNETPLTLESRWFQPVDGGFQLDNAIRNMVTFAPLNLVADSESEDTLPRADIILCRNVGMYLEPQAMERVYTRLSQSLSTCGWLLTGHAEPMPDAIEGFETLSFGNAVIYQKADESVPLEQQNVPISAPPVIISSAPAPVIDDNPLTDALAQAQMAANAEDWEEALAWLDESEQGDMLQPYLHYLRAVVQMHLGHSESAFVSLRKAIYCDPGFALAHFMLGECAQSGKDFVAAARHWRRARWTLRHLDEAAPLPYTPELTVADLTQLIQYRLETIGDTHA